jgi:hypothetical protein
LLREDDCTSVKTHIISENMMSRLAEEFESGEAEDETGGRILDGKRSSM